MMRWTLAYARDVVTYLTKPREDRSEIRRRVRSLGQGIPESAIPIQERPETWRWDVAQHRVVFVVDQETKWIHVTVVRPLRVDV